MKHGKGKWRSAKGPPCNIYDGEYQKDRKHGFGRFIWASGNQYQGEYFEDDRHGYGEMRWTDGSWYQGEWDRGI